MSESLAEVVEALRGTLGSQLKRVEYGLLPSDSLTPSAIELGGEVVLTSTGEEKVHFTWGGRPGAGQDWAQKIGDRPRFRR